jgi:hypothetical protein
MTGTPFFYRYTVFLLSDVWFFETLKTPKTVASGARDLNLMAEDQQQAQAYTFSMPNRQRADAYAFGCFILLGLLFYIGWAAGNAANEQQFAVTFNVLSV